MIIGINVISGLLLLLGGVGGIWGTFTPYLGDKGGSLFILGGNGGRAPLARQPEAVIEFRVGKALLVTYGCLLALAGPMYPSTKEKDRYLLSLVLILAILAAGLTFLPMLHPFSRIRVPFWEYDPPNEIFDKFFGLFLQSAAVVAVLVGACMKAWHEWRNTGFE